MKRTRVKICGITRREDAELAETLGADAIGFVFVPRSKRHVAPSTAAEISRELGPMVQRVGLFLDAEAAHVAAALDRLPGLLPQFHGRETAAFCESFGVPYIKALGGRSGWPDSDEIAAYAGASAFLLDSHEPGELGGTGQVFDWSGMPVVRPRYMILAGGLHAGNVGKAIADIAPHAVDVSSGVETSPGVKCRRKLGAFFDAVRSADSTRCS
ncbi:MAG: phosphoribosylanthranilate isomerase [Gammaproteobacteria bacterium]|nr:MAG: phosphoribosylanthranilate isomerase [Gammaproteobacteria bacterium]PIE36706.1 MAG: phosphoribosylanthranilate isomerase [Gammaproteobacteria bacterium]